MVLGRRRTPFRLLHIGVALLPPGNSTFTSAVRCSRPGRCREQRRHVSGAQLCDLDHLLEHLAVVASSGGVEDAEAAPNSGVLLPGSAKLDVELAAAAAAATTARFEDIGVAEPDNV